MRHAERDGLTFGPRLKQERERRGITLEALAASTKIKLSLLADLERNRLDHWPEGIYRRAWLREYATVIGIAPQPLLEEFTRLFPEDGARPTEEGETAPFRLTFSEVPRPRAQSMRARVIDAMLVLLAVLTSGGIVTALSGLSFWTAMGLVGLIWSPIVSVYGSPVTALRRRATRTAALRRPPPAAPKQASGGGELSMPGPQAPAADTMRHLPRLAAHLKPSAPRSWRRKQAEASVNASIRPASQQGAQRH